ncbi:MAG: PilZ domain-containing protein [Acidobacteria bacterium]|nr:PilZ domain-containing protein [Acidobacteriota bacterium]
MTESVGLLTREFHVRLLNFSPSGCLVETNTRVDIGTIGFLQFVIDGKEFADDVQVVRCQHIEGAGSLYHIGARFLWTEAATKGTLRRALERPVRSNAGSRSPRAV